jgi:hypothetical protein
VVETGSVWLGQRRATGEMFVTLSLDRLFQLRLVVARQGEMDAARWWGTAGVLGRHGSIVLSRGFPRTQGFIQARVVFAVARARCSELLDAPGVMTLWNLPTSIEDEFEAAWHTWLDEPERWRDALQAVSEPAPTGILDRLRRFHLLTPTTSALVANLRTSADGRAILVPGEYEPNDEIVTALAAAFDLAESGRLVVPFVRLRD